MAFAGFFVFFKSAYATDYYVDATLGNDAFFGDKPSPLSGNGPLKSLARLASKLKAGDRGFLKCGEVWRESMVLSTAGTANYPIKIFSYGDCYEGNKPELRLSKIVSMSATGGYLKGIYTQPIAMVFLNGKYRSIARYPASDLPLIEYLSSAAQFRLPDPIKSYAKSQLAGAVVSVRVNPHDIEERVITDVPVPGMAQLDRGFKYIPVAGAPYYLEGKPWMIASAGDWAWGNDAHTELVAHNTTIGQFEVSGDVSGITINEAHFISIDGLKISNAGGAGVDVENSNNVNLTNLEIANVRYAFIRAKNSKYLSVTESAGDSSQYDGVVLTRSPSAQIVGNVFRNVGMLSNPKKSIAAIALPESWHATVENNHVEKAAYVGVLFDVGSKVLGNVILDACLRLDDCGYIYTSAANKIGGYYGHDYYGAKVNDNLILDRGVVQVGVPLRLVAGVYLDDFSAAISVVNNYVEGVERGFYLHNTRDTWLHLNTAFDSKVRNLMVSERGALTNTFMANNLAFDNNLIAPSNIPSVLVDSSLGVEGIAAVTGNNYAANEFGPTMEVWMGSTITRVLPDLSSTHWSKDSFVVANQSNCNTTSLYWTSAISKVDTAQRSQWKLWSTMGDAKRVSDSALHVQAGATGETIASSPLFYEQAGKDHVLSLSGKFTGGQARVPVVLRQSAYPYTNKAAVIYVYPDYEGNFNLCTVFRPHTSEASARLDIHLKPTDELRVDFVALKEATYQPPAKRFASLTNISSDGAYLNCPFGDSQSCEGALLLDRTPAQWPMYLPPRSGRVVFIP